MLEGNLLVKIVTVSPPFNKDRIQIWDWNGVDIRKESQGTDRDKQSIQYRVIQKLISADQFSVIFDDDGAGEIADVVSISDDKDKVCIQFYHCKYAHGDIPGSRVSDLYEVCGQSENPLNGVKSHRLSSIAL